jgi:hypothetical protein
MSYRRSKEASVEARAWKRFVQSNREQLERTGLPCSFYESHDMWDDFLMHGYIDHHDDASGFTVHRMSEESRVVLSEVVVAYLAAGFGDPGLTLFGTERDEELRRRAGRLSSSE